MKQNKNKYYICTAKFKAHNDVICLHRMMNRAQQQIYGEVAQLVRARDS
jgi:hypothetical protein